MVVEGGLRLKRLHAPSADAAWTAGRHWRQAMERIASHPECPLWRQVARSVLQGLGPDPGSIQEILDRPFLKCAHRRSRSKRVVTL